MIDLIRKVPESLREVYAEIVALTDRFCDDYLNDAYRDLCRKAAAELCGPGSPKLDGGPTLWASGVVFAVGCVNSLTDPSQDPHMRTESIAGALGVSVDEMQARCEAVCDRLELDPLDLEYMLPSRVPEHPLAWLVEVNGRMLDARVLAPEVQEAAFAEGLIPYLPGGQAEAA